MSMPGAEAGSEGTYQWLFRALGAYLDGEPSSRITLAETPEGFVVRFQAVGTAGEPVVVQLRRDALVGQIHALPRSTKSTARTRHQGIWWNFPNGHQDFFRALGFELDEARARDVLLDELEDQLILTYSYPDPGAGTRQKRMIILGIPDIEAILNAAFERRGTLSAPAE
jgi:hypothetical protein